MSRTTTRVLQTPEERKEARSVVSRMYKAQGYSDDDGGGIAAFAAGSQATIWGIFLGESLFGTIAAIEDSQYGLPMDAVFKLELDKLRHEGARLIEVGQFAVDHKRYSELSGGKYSPFVAAPLMAAVFAHGLHKKSDYLCICISPKHSAFYERVGFRPTGNLRHYAAVNTPAIAKTFHLSEWMESPFVRGLLTAEHHFE